MARLKIVGIGGSVGRDSASRAALRTALHGAVLAGAQTELLDLHELELPIYDPDRESAPHSALRLAEAVRGADGLIWSTPLYHGTLSGALKNALDWLELLGDDPHPYLTGKPVGLISVAGGSHALQAINSMEFVVRALRGWTVPFVVPIGKAGHAITPEGEVRDPKVREQLEKLGREVALASAHFSRREPK